MNELDIMGSQGKVYQLKLSLLKAGLNWTEISFVIYGLYCGIINVNCVY